MPRCCAPSTLCPSLPVPPALPCTPCSYARIARCSGHSSYVTHIDWSADSRIIQSTCGAYELLYFEASTGKQVL